MGAGAEASTRGKMGEGMKLGFRLTVVTALLMGAALSLLVMALVQVRRADLESDLRARVRELSHVLAAGLEPLARENARELVTERTRALAESLRPYQFDLLVIEPERPADPGWAQLVEAAIIDKRPVGRVFNPPDRPPFFAMAVPLHDATAGAPARETVAVLGIRRDVRDLERALKESLRAMLPLLLGGVCLFGLAVYLLLRSSVLRPLRRLNDGIDAVAAGDLSRALLPQRDDEIGVLASRFNAMTTSLREAREVEARATAARSTLEVRLRHSEKLATMGQMAAQIAHELGTPLNVIDGRARALAKRAADPAEVQKNAEIISTQVERITRIIRQLLSFSRKSRPTLTRVDVAQVVEESLGFVAEALRTQGVTANVTVVPGVPEIPGDPGEVQQVCLNLLNNALQAMPNGGRLQVTLAQVVRRKEGLALSDPAPYLMLEVADSGPGVPEANRERIFEPFFTTKAEGAGTGLGLAVSTGIVNDHDGWIEVDNQPTGGAVFRVYLPVGSESVTAEQLPTRGDARP